MRPLTDGELTAVVGVTSAFIGATVAIIAAWLTNRANAKVAVAALIEVYFPKLSTQYSIVIKLRDEANEMLGDHRAAYSVGNTDGAKFIKPFLAKTKEINVAAQNLSEALFENLREA